MSTREFDAYRVVKVDDDRKMGPDYMHGTTEYAVIGEMNPTITDSGGWVIGTSAFLYTTETGPYDGGRQICEAWIEGYKNGLPAKPRTVVVSGCPDDCDVTSPVYEGKTS